MAITERVEQFLTGVEISLLGGETWAMRRDSLILERQITFWDRFGYFRAYGCWPGTYGRVVTQMAAQADIDGERARGSDVCAEIKLVRARGVKLNIE